MDDPKFATPQARYENRDELNQLIADITVDRTSQAWIALFNEVGVPCGPINNIEEVFDDPQVQHLGMAHPVEHSTLGKFNILSQAVKLSRTPFEIHSATPELGEHTDEILKECGLNADQVAKLREKGII